jgi:hypothetical protein
MYLARMYQIGNSARVTVTQLHRPLVSATSESERFLACVAFCTGGIGFSAVVDVDDIALLEGTSPVGSDSMRHLANMKGRHRYTPWEPILGKIDLTGGTRLAALLFLREAELLT